MHAKYEVSISYGSKVVTKVKVDTRQTGQKQYAPDHAIRGHKIMAWKRITDGWAIGLVAPIYYSDFARVIYINTVLQNTFISLQ